MENTKGKLIVFEGLDACGKDTQMDLLEGFMADNEIPYVRIKNVSNSLVGQYIKKAQVGDEYFFGNIHISLLFLSELAYISNHVKSSLNSGINVICSRWYYSTLAYIGETEEELKLVGDIINKLIEEGSVLKPDVVIYLDVDADTAIKRIEERDETVEHFEKVDKLREIKIRYDVLKEQHNFMKIKGNSIEEISSNIQLFMDYFLDLGINGFEDDIMEVIHID